MMAGSGVQVACGPPSILRAAPPCADRRAAPRPFAVRRPAGAPGAAVRGLYTAHRAGGSSKSTTSADEVLVFAPATLALFAVATFLGLLAAYGAHLSCAPVASCCSALLPALEHMPLGRLGH